MKCVFIPKTVCFLENRNLNSSLALSLPEKRLQQQPHSFMKLICKCSCYKAPLKKDFKKMTYTSYLRSNKLHSNNIAILKLLTLRIFHDF